MKIAFLADSFLLDESTGVNGTQVQMYNLASAFKSRGMEVHYISLTRDRKRMEEVVGGIKVHLIQQKTSVFSWIYEVRHFKRILNKVMPDVLYQRGRSHLTYIAANWSERNGKKFVWGSNGEDSCDYWKLIKRLRRSQTPLWKKLLLYPYMALQDCLIHKGIRGANQVVNQTEHQKSRLQENYGKKGIVIPSYFLPSSGQLKQNKEKVVLWLANLSPGKQPELFLRLAEYCADCPGWMFILGGEASDRHNSRAISRQAATLQNVEIIGSVPFEETHECFSRASLFANTSLKEADGLPNTFIQAWLNQTPVLSLNHDPNSWIGAHNLGFCAYGNMEEFLRKGKAILKNSGQLEKMGKNCEQFASKKFTAEEIIETYLNLFKEL